MKLAVFVLATALGVTAAAQQQVYDVGNGVTAPVVVREVKPSYSPGAKAKKIQGAVLLKAVVEDTGRVDNITVATSLDPELDAQAVSALAQWDFRPGTRAGQPVPVRITCELEFALK